jgi:hypothetical protein
MITTHSLCGAAVALLAGAASAAPDGAWSYQEAKDPITDAKRGIAVLVGDGGSLVVKCDAIGPTSIYLQITSEKYLGELRNAIRPVAMRVDDGQVVNTDWYHDGRLALITENERATPFAYAFAKARKIVFRLTSDDGEPVDVVLTSNGSSALVHKAFATCGQAWTGAADELDAAAQSVQTPGQRSTPKERPPATSPRARSPAAPTAQGVCGLVPQPSGAVKLVPC